MQIIKYDKDELERLDVFLTNYLPDISRSQLKKHIDNEDILVNDKKVKAGYSLQKGDVIKVNDLITPQFDLTPQDIPLEIIYENQDYAIINKPQGMVVHPAVGNYEGTLVNALLYKIKNLSNVNGEYRPGIVHRLDKDTSGLLVVAKNDKAHRELAKQIETKECKRFYLALVEGIVTDGGVIETNLARSNTDRKKYAVCSNNVGKKAITYYKVIENFKNHTLIECELKTGRTHQIRVHCQYIHHPIVGDKTYGYKKQTIATNGQLLHAYKLVLREPNTNVIKVFTCELPSYFQEILNKLKKQK